MVWKVRNADGLSFPVALALVLWAAQVAVGKIHTASKATPRYRLVVTLPQFEVMVPYASQGKSEGENSTNSTAIGWGVQRVPEFSLFVHVCLRCQFQESWRTLWKTSKR